MVNLLGIAYSKFVERRADLEGRRGDELLIDLSGGLAAMPAP